MAILFVLAYRRRRNDTMQEVLAQLIRGIGYVGLKIVTLGRYRSAGHAEVPEGAIGLAIVAAIVWIGYWINR